MSKKEFVTSKFYYGFPVFIIGYKDENHGYNCTTLSSSYSLGNMMVIGIYRHGNAIKQIKKYREFTVNVPDKSLMNEIEMEGFISGEDKFSIISSLTHHKSERIDAPIIENCFLNIECEVVDIIESTEFKDYSHIIAKVKGRLIDEEFLKDGVFVHEKFDAVVCAGDEKLRSYRYLSQEFEGVGSFYHKSSTTL